jgi:hypothetical protein
MTMARPSENQPLRNVLLAAQALLDARENQMVTEAEWQALINAVTVAAPRDAGGPGETFVVYAAGGALLRRVVPKRGKPYEHACSKQVYEDVAYAIENLGSAPFTMEEVRAKIGGGDEAAMPPWTQVSVAIAFLKERGCIEPARDRKHVAATDDIYTDAMIEYHALREKGPEPAGE